MKKFLLTFCLAALSGLAVGAETIAENSAETAGIKDYFPDYVSPEEKQEQAQKAAKEKKLAKQRKRETKRIEKPWFVGAHYAFSSPSNSNESEYINDSGGSGENFYAGKWFNTSAGIEFGTLKLDGFKGYNGFGISSKMDSDLKYFALLFGGTEKDGSRYYFKIGAFNAENTETLTKAGLSPSVETVNSSTTSWLLGLGGGITLNAKKSWQVAGSMDLIGDLVDDKEHVYDASLLLFTIGLKYNFIVF